MALVLNSEAVLVRDTAHQFFAERSPITALRKLRDTNDPDGFSRDLWREMAELGWTGFLVPEDHGGTEFGVTGLAQVMEAAGRTLAATPLLTTALIGASALALAGTRPAPPCPGAPRPRRRRTPVRAGAGGRIPPPAAPDRRLGGSGW